MGGTLTKQKAPSSHGKAEKTKKTKAPGPGPVPPLPYLDPGSPAKFGQADYDAIYEYTTNSGYKIMNPYLRNPDSYPPEAAAAIQARSELVSAALAKLPPQPGVTIRGADLPEDVLKNYEEGTVVTERAFTSTSVDPWVVAKKSFQGNVIMAITGKSGRDISRFSMYPTEQEVLYDKGNQFIITGRSWDPTYNKWIIVLEEFES